MGWWIVGTEHLRPREPFVGWDRGDDHPAFAYQGIVHPVVMSIQVDQA